MSLILVMFVNMVSKFDANTLRVVSGVVRRCTKGLINAGWRGEKNAIAIVIMTIASRQGFNKNKEKKNDFFFK
jgi:hypothetical protein